LFLHRAVPARQRAFVQRCQVARLRVAALERELRRTNLGPPLVALRSNRYGEKVADAS
jgi:hypothetical protein